MQIKTFRAKTIQEAFQQVRDKLGPDACVLDTREVRAGITRRTMIEVDASAQPAWPHNRISPLLAQDSAPTNGNTVVDEFDQPSIASQLLQQELSKVQEPGVAGKAARSNLPFDSSVHSGYVHSDRVHPGHTHPGYGPQMADDSSNAPTSFSTDAPLVRRVTPAAQQVLAELLGLGVEENLSAELVHLALLRCADEFRNNDWLLRGQVGQIVAERIEVASQVETSSNEQRIVAVVGPSGTGKTTLLSKLAHQAYLENNLQIGIIALDTWRHGAVEQLVQLADEVAAEIEVVGSTDHIARSMQRLRELDLVLIDTSGRSPQDADQLQSLKQALEMAQPDETHLVLNANSTQAHAALCLSRFQSVGASQICLTNLDHSHGAGQWLQPLFAAGLPIQYLSHGPQSHKDLLATNKRHLTSILLGQTSLQASPASEYQTSR